MVYRKKSNELDIKEYIREHLRDLVDCDTEILLLDLSINDGVYDGTYVFGDGKKEITAKIEYKPIEEDEFSVGVFKPVTKKNKTASIDLTIDSEDGWFFNNYIITISSVNEL